MGKRFRDCNLNQKFLLPLSFHDWLPDDHLARCIGDVLGILIGLAVPFSVRYFTEYRIPISGLSAIIAIVVSSLVGVLFGTVPAIRASQLDPVESLRYE